ncbi:universal stress protein [Defluviimonas sp. WL0050]|uniref:Universal stress protein n=1 Tax=Albidovulum litorale TaxID=2984134 RepID=A0ABT2ZT17_9RHOB|nr:MULTISPECIES: universal stress protein [Defluviimonas]MCV2874303.1 universal stress protein [Defluviimonas sp. WL0050]MDI3336584.1 universal stress protein [Defluviimonas aestuarii]
MYKKILIPMALDHGIGISAIGVARQLLDEGGEMVALHVYEAPQGSVRTYLDDETVNSAFKAARARLEQRVADQKDVTPVILAGHTGRTIADYADEIGADCIVIGSHKPGLKDYFLGSTAARVVRHASCSVHVLR